MRATALLGDIAHVVHPAEGTFDLSGYTNIADAVVGVIARHPMREEELLHTLDQWPAPEVQKALAELEAHGGARRIVRYGSRFWTAAAGRYSKTQRTTH
jgi:hypothetical protein